MKKFKDLGVQKSVPYNQTFLNKRISYMSSLLYRIWLLQNIPVNGYE